MRKLYRIWCLCWGFIGLAKSGVLFFYGSDLAVLMLWVVYSITMFNAHDIALIEEKMEKL